MSAQTATTVSLRTAQVNRRRTNIGYELPCEPPSMPLKLSHHSYGTQVTGEREFSISTSGGPTLDNPRLGDLAHRLSLMDRFVVLDYHYFQSSEAIQSQLLPVPEVSQYALKESEGAWRLLRQIEAVSSRDEQFSAEYLKSSHLLKYWQFQRDKTRLSRDKLRTSYPKAPGQETQLQTMRSELYQLEDLEREAVPVPELLAKAIRAGDLDEDSRDAIRDRWLIFDQIIDIMHFFGHTTRISLSWSEIVLQISGGDSDHGVSSNIQRDPDGISTFMWLTFVATILVSFPTFGPAFQYSAHKPGTVRDAEFWFLLQACGMQALSLVTMGIPMWQGDKLSGHKWYWTWGFMAVAVICTILAPVLYCEIPTEWSGFLTVIASSIQAFVTLQVSLIVNDGSKKVKKE